MEETLCEICGELINLDDANYTDDGWGEYIICDQCLADKNKEFYEN